MSVVVEEPVLPPTEMKRVEFTKQVKSSERKGSNEKVSYSIYVSDIEIAIENSHS